jgi:hypothetical protein
VAWNASIFGEQVVSDFIESRRFPFRGVYPAPLGAVGVLIACIGSWGTPIETIQSRVEQAAFRLAPLFEQTPAMLSSHSEAA